MDLIKQKQHIQQQQYDEVERDNEMVTYFVDRDLGTSAGEEINTDAEEAVLNPKTPVASTGINL